MTDQPHLPDDAGNASELFEEVAEWDPWEADIVYWYGCFDYRHLPPHLQAVSAVFHHVASYVAGLPSGPDIPAALHDLLRAKDGAVRQVARAYALGTWAPPDGQDRYGSLPDRPGPLHERLLLALGINPADIDPDRAVEAAARIKADAHRFPQAAHSYSDQTARLEVLRYLGDRLADHLEHVDLTSTPDAVEQVAEWRAYATWIEDNADDNPLGLEGDNHDD